MNHIKKFKLFNNGSHGKQLDWYYTEYDPKTKEGAGFFGTPTERQYYFRDELRNGSIIEIGLGCKR